jgi:hypothetical protein
MKTIFNKKTGIFFVITILSLLYIFSNVYATSTNVTLTYPSSAVVQLKTLSYSPYPVSPGGYFDLWVNAQIVGNVGDIQFKLDPQFPFSLDSNQTALQDYGAPQYSPNILLHYVVRVDPNAVNGINKLYLDYQAYGNWYTQELDIDVQNSQTSFDSVIQSISGSSVSIGIANIGQNPANAVIVKIPQQSGFRAVGTNGQIVGNLQSGDYTLVNFNIASTRSFTGTAGSRPQTNSSSFIQNSSSNQLQFEIDYTDNIGIRRTVNMQLPLALTGNSSTGTFTRNRSSWSVWYTVLIILGVLIILFILYKKLPKKYTNKIFKKRKQQVYSPSAEIPEWVKNEKEKGKRK